MTILTKASSDKKPDKVPLPLVLGPEDVAMLHGGLKHGGALLTRPSAPELDAESMVFNRPEYSCIRTILLFLISLLVMSMGVLGGYTLYRMYAPPPSNNMHLRATCDIPYWSPRSNLTLPRFHIRPEEIEATWRTILPSPFGNDDTFPDLDDNFFREEIELDMTDDESYTKIEVPNFKDGRHGRFMHDFKENQSAIIDTTANRCFIMPLDRDTTLPPKSFMDLMQKMGSGYYNIDTERVRRNMRVVLPAISDLSLISERIANECYDMKVYMLENYVSGVFKREIKPITDGGKFAEFLGKGVIEFDIVNIADIEEYERKQQK